ncbi:hypothetical protein SCLCIDRAFT_25985, partial [Scleroderma citrinum Foug A]
EVKRQTATQSSALAQIGSKDVIITQQSEALEKLQRAVLEAKAEIQRLQADRESEILALNHNYETTLHKVQELQSQPPSTSPPVSKRPARPRSTLGSGQLVCHYLDEDAQEQGLSETPAAPQSAPASTAQVLPSQSGSGQSTSASTTARVPPTVAPPALGNDDLRRIVEELYQHINAGSQPTSTSTPKRDRRKVQGLHQEVETDVQRIKNLVSIFVPYDCLQPTSSLLRDMLGICHDHAQPLPRPSRNSNPSPATPKLIAVPQLNSGCYINPRPRTSSNRLPATSLV